MVPYSVFPGQMLFDKEAAHVPSKVPESRTPIDARGRSHLFLSLSRLRGSIRERTTGGDRPRSPRCTEANGEDGCGKTVLVPVADLTRLRGTERRIASHRPYVAHHLPPPRSTIGQRNRR